MFQQLDSKSVDQALFLINQTLKSTDTLLKDGDIDSQGLISLLLTSSSNVIESLMSSSANNDDAVTRTIGSLVNYVDAILQVTPIHCSLVFAVCYLQR